METTTSNSDQPQPEGEALRPFQLPNINFEEAVNDDIPMREDIRDNETAFELSLSFTRILQHFAVATGQKHSHLTILLKLLKHHKPEPEYDTLPSTGEKLLEIDGQDFSTKSTTIFTLHYICK